MGCNCNKNKVKPLGPSKPQKSTSPPTTAPMKPKSTTQSFVLQKRDGTTQTFGSRLEAEAARVRSGGGSIR